jgi:hypothetical protein
MNVSPVQLSVAVREVRIRLARDDIHTALGPVSHHALAARLCLELDDDIGLEHHLRHVVDEVRCAAQKHRELRGHLASIPATGDASARMQAESKKTEAA